MFCSAVNDRLRNCFAAGTPEVGGLTAVQALEIVRGCRGLNIIGGDLVEVGQSQMMI